MASRPSSRLVDRWYAWDVFRSPLFAGILALLSIAIAVCTINRVPGIWQTISEPRVRTSAGYLERAETSARFTTTLPAEGLAASYGEVLKGKRYRVMTEEVGTETHIYADKNRYGKMGTFPFHLALILLLVGGIVGAHYGFREPEFVIPEGQTREVGNGTDLSVELVQFQDSYTPMGIAEQYEADIVVYDGNDEVRRETISPNHPVSYRIHDVLPIGIRLWRADAGDRRHRQRGLQRRGRCWPVQLCRQSGRAGRVRRDPRGRTPR